MSSHEESAGVASESESDWRCCPGIESTVGGPFMLLDELAMAAALRLSFQLSELPFFRQ